MADEIVVLITAGSADEAGKIAAALVDERLAACVNIVPEVRSVFFWDGRRSDERETLMVCKSRLALMTKLVERVKALHSYSVPEVIALPIVAGSSEYLNWINESTKKQAPNPK